MKSLIQSQQRKLKVAETYFKLNIDYQADTLEKLELILKAAAEKSLPESNFGEDAIYEISFDKGSTKAKVTFFALLNAAIFYADLRESIPIIYKDAQRLSELVINTAKQKPLVEENIIRTERRTGIVGRLKRASDRIEFLQKDLDNLGNNSIREELNSLYQEIADLIQLIEPVDREAATASFSQELKDKLPPPDDKQVKHLYNLYALKPEEEED